MDEILLRRVGCNNRIKKNLCLDLGPDPDPDSTRTRKGKHRLPCLLKARSDEGGEVQREPPAPLSSSLGLSPRLGSALSLAVDPYRPAATCNHPSDADVAAAGDLQVRVSPFSSLLSFATPPPLCALVSSCDSLSFSLERLFRCAGSLFEPPPLLPYITGDARKADDLSSGDSFLA